MIGFNWQISESGRIVDEIAIISSSIDICGEVYSCKHFGVYATDVAFTRRVSDIDDAAFNVRLAAVVVELRGASIELALNLVGRARLGRGSCEEDEKE